MVITRQLGPGKTAGSGFRVYGPISNMGLFVDDVITKGGMTELDCPLGVW